MGDRGNLHTQVTITGTTKKERNWKTDRIYRYGFRKNKNIYSNHAILGDFVLYCASEYRKS